MNIRPQHWENNSNNNNNRPKEHLNTYRAAHTDSTHTVLVFLQFAKKKTHVESPKRAPNIHRAAYMDSTHKVEVFRQFAKIVHAHREQH